MTAATHTLELRILLPTQELLADSVIKVVAEAHDGEFCVLPKHIDFVAALVPSVLSYWTEEQDGTHKVNYAAIDRGVFIKYANCVTIASVDGVQSEDLQQLQSEVDQHFLELDEHERKARTALARLEAATLRGFRELQERLHD